MINIHSEWTYGRKYIHSSTGYNMHLVYVVYDVNGMYVCETETEEAAKLICKLPEFYDMVKEFIDPDLNPDFDYRGAEDFIDHVDFLCGYEAKQEAQS